MLTKKKDPVFTTIYIALIFLCLGLFTSPTVVSLYHILLLVPTVLLIWRGERIRISKSSYALIALFLWGMVTTAFNFSDLIKPFKAFQELKYYLLGVLCIFPLQYFFRHARDKHYKTLLNIFYFTLIAAFFVGVTKAFLGFDIIKWKSGDFHNRSGGFLNYMRYGYGSAFIVLLGSGLYLANSRIRELLTRKLFFPAMILSFLAIFTAKTRGALLALMVGSPILLLKFKKKVALSIIAMGVVFVLIVGYISFFSNSNIRFLDINDGSNKKRMSQFYSAVKSIQEKPVFGLGADQFSYHVTDIKTRYNIWSKQYSGHSHNIFLEHAANYGIPGLLLFMIFLSFWLWELYREGSKTSWAILSYLVGFITSGQVELLFDNLNSHLFFFVYSASQIYLFSQRAKSLKSSK